MFFAHPSTYKNFLMQQNLKTMASVILYLKWKKKPTQHSDIVLRERKDFAEKLDHFVYNTR